MWPPGEGRGYCSGSAGAAAQQFCSLALFMKKYGFISVLCFILNGVLTFFSTIQGSILFSDGWLIFENMGEEVQIIYDWDLIYAAVSVWKKANVFCVCK